MLAGLKNAMAKREIKGLEEAMNYIRKNDFETELQPEMIEGMTRYIDDLASMPGHLFYIMASSPSPWQLKTIMDKIKCQKVKKMIKTVESQECVVLLLTGG